MVFYCRDESLWVDSEEVGFFFVRVDFPILVGNVAFLKRYPETLDERAELYTYGCIVNETTLT